MSESADTELDLTEEEREQIKNDPVLTIADVRAMREGDK